MKSTKSFKEKFEVLKLKYFKKSSNLRRNSDTAHTFQNFGENTTIHGIRFLTKRHNSKLVRLFWIISLIISLILLIWNAERLYIKLKVLPDIAIAEKQGLSRDIPYPAVTICMPAFAKNGLANYSHYYEEYYYGRENLLNLTEKYKSYLLANAIRCEVKNIESIQDCCENSNISNIIELLEESSLTLNEAFAHCYFKTFSKNCTSMVQPILTANGFCFATNMQSINQIYRKETLSNDFKRYVDRFSSSSSGDVNWTLDDGYKQGSSDFVTPHRLNKQNIQHFRHILKQADFYNPCDSKFMHFKIHLPNEIPTIFHRKFSIETNRIQRITIDANVMKAHPSLKSFSPHARECYFSGERQLQFFKIYTKYHCFMECLADYILRKCGCVEYFMPRNSSTQICNLDKKDCARKHKTLWPDHEDLGEKTTPCFCYPTCNDIEYSVSVVDSGYHFEEKLSPNENFYSYLIIRYKNHEVKIFEKYASYKLQDYIADLGGLFGFFLGCSLLSLIEVLYFIFMAIQEKCQKRNLNDLVKMKTSESANHDFLRSLNHIGSDVYIMRSPLFKRDQKFLSEA